MSLTHEEFSSKGGRASWRGLTKKQKSARARKNALSGTPEERSARARKARLAGIEKKRKAALVELKCATPNLDVHCTGCTDPHSEGTHAGCTIEDVKRRANGTPDRHRIGTPLGVGSGLSR